MNNSIHRKLSNSFNFFESNEGRSFFCNVMFMKKFNLNHINVDGINLMKIQSFKINKLKEKIKKMKLINKSIVASMTIPEINCQTESKKMEKNTIVSFDQYFTISCLETLRKEIIALKEKLEYYQKENLKITQELNYYKNENNRLVNILKKLALDKKRHLSNSNLLQNSESIKNTFHYSTHLNSLTNPQNCQITRYKQSKAIKRS